MPTARSVSPDLEARILALAATVDGRPVGSGSVSHLAGGPESPDPPRGWLSLVVWVPHLPRSEANAGGKRRAEIARKTATKEAVRRELPPAPFGWPRPVRVRLTRCGGKRLDKDNLARSFKAVQDVLAEWLGVDDGDPRAVRWSYKQRPGYAGGVEIRIGGQ
jgi:hypothetical protein